MHLITVISENHVKYLLLEEPPSFQWNPQLRLASTPCTCATPWTHHAVEQPSVVGPCLPPHPVMVSGVRVSIRVGRRKDVPGTQASPLLSSPVKVLQKVGMSIIVLHQLLQHPGGGSRGDPLPGMDSSVYPHRWLANTAVLGPMGSLIAKKKIVYFEILATLSARPS